MRHFVRTHPSDRKRRSAARLGLRGKRPGGRLDFAYSYASPFTTCSHLTPGITRRPAPLLNDESRRVGGRVHAVVMLPPLWKQFVVISMRADPEPHDSFRPIEA